MYSHTKTSPQNLHLIMLHCATEFHTKRPQPIFRPAGWIEGSWLCWHWRSLRKLNSSLPLAALQILGCQIFRWKRPGHWFSSDRGGEGLGDRTRPLMVYPLKHVSGKASPRNITPKTSCRDETSGALGRSIDSKTFKRQARRQASTTALEDNGLQCVSWSTFSCVLCRWNDVRAVHHWFIGFMTAWWCTRSSCTYGHSTLFY